MLQEAKRQLESVSIEQIKEILRKNIKSEFDKMIIDDKAEIKRADYYYSVLKYKKSDRKIMGISFPLFDRVKNDFSLFEGGIKQFGEKEIVNQKKYISVFQGVKGADIFEISIDKIANAFDAPFDEENDEVKSMQRKYFLPRYTFSAICEKCSGQRYIKCTNSECKGKHEWRCGKCIGDGKVACSNCKGGGYTKCWTCSGSGKITKTEHLNGKTHQRKVNCHNCSGQGRNSCSKCNTQGVVRCSTCGGDGIITCKRCYGDTQRRGLIDCPTCLTAGVNAQFVYVETLVQNLNTSKLLKTGDDLGLDENIVRKHIKEDLKFICFYKHLNEKITDENDEISRELTGMYETQLDLSKTNFPIILKEEMTYQVIPALKISYKHILTNEIHELTIVNFWSNPQIILHSEAEKLKTSIKSISKAVGGFFSKAFKTKGYLKKEDRKIEIKLMIYLAKADGKIEEKEKEYLSEEISNLKEFKNSEKKELFDLMNAEVLPELTSEDVQFSDEEKAKETIEKLTQLALSDGEFEANEKQLIENIKTLINKKED